MSVLRHKEGCREIRKRYVRGATKTGTCGLLPSAPGSACSMRRATTRGDLEWRIDVPSHHEELWDVVEAERIVVEYEDGLADGDEHLLGAYWWDPVVERHVIVLDKDLLWRPALQATVLGEEVGHAMVGVRRGSWVTRPADRVVVYQDELRAIRWACEVLVPVHEFIEAARRGLERPSEFAEEFLVTEWLIHRRWGFLRETDRSLGAMVRTTSSGMAAVS